MDLWLNSFYVVKSNKLQALASSMISSCCEGWYQRHNSRIDWTRFVQSVIIFICWEVATLHMTCPWSKLNLNQNRQQINSFAIIEYVEGTCDSAVNKGASPPKAAQSDHVTNRYFSNLPWCIRWKVVMVGSAYNFGEKCCWITYPEPNNYINTINTSFCEKTIEISQVWKKKVGTKTHIFLRMWARNKKNTGKTGHARFFWSQSCYFCPHSEILWLLPRCIPRLGHLCPHPWQPSQGTGICSTAAIAAPSALRALGCRLVLGIIWQCIPKLLIGWIRLEYVCALVFHHQKSWWEYHTETVNVKQTCWSELKDLQSSSHIAGVLAVIRKEWNFKEPSCDSLWWFWDSSGWRSQTNQGI